MKKRKTKYKWNNIFKAVSGLFLIVITIAVMVGSCARTEASSTVPTKKYFDVPLSTELQDHIFTLCEEYGIAPEIIVAMIERESNYDDGAVGDNGKSVGLMQIQEHNHYDRIERLGVTDLFDPFENVEVGIDFFAQCVTRNGGNVEMALMSYNAGQNGAETNYFSKGIYSNAYSQKVLKKAQILKEGMIEMNFFERKCIKPSFHTYFIDAMGAMALGLFASLLIGTIFGTIYDKTGIEFFASMKQYATSATGPAMAVAIGSALSLCCWLSLKFTWRTYGHIYSSGRCSRVRKNCIKRNKNRYSCYAYCYHCSRYSNIPYYRSLDI